MKISSLSQNVRHQNSLAAVIAYDRFCCLNSSYHHSMSNQLHMMRWVDERRIEDGGRGSGALGPEGAGLRAGGKGLQGRFGPALTNDS
jgi:hypothetical protein